MFCYILLYWPISFKRSEFHSVVKHTNYLWLMLVVTEDSSSTPLLGPIVYWTKLPIVFLIWETLLREAVLFLMAGMCHNCSLLQRVRSGPQELNFAFRPWSVFFIHPTLLTFFKYFIYFMLRFWFPPNLSTFSAAWVAPKYCSRVLKLDLS